MKKLDSAPREKWSFRLAAAATILAIGSILVAALLAWTGPAYSLWETPPSPSVQVTPATAHVQVSSLPEGPFAGWSYVAPAHEYVGVYSSDFGGVELVTITSGFGSEGPITQVCGGSVNGMYYPGSGSTVFVTCYVSSHATAFVVGNVSDISARSNFTVGAHLLPDQYAWDEQGHRLFLTSFFGTSERLYTISTDGGLLTSNISLPGTYEDPILFDGSDGQLLVGDYGNRTLLSVDPSTGASSIVLGMTGNATGIFSDPGNDHLFVAYETGTAGGAGGVEILNASTLEPIATQPVTSTGITGAFLDPTRNEIDFTDGSNFWFLNSSTDRISEAAGTIWDSASFLVGLDTSTDQISAVSNYWGGLQSVVHIYDFATSTTTFPPFSAVPDLGTATPWVIGLVGAVTGAVIWVARFFWVYSTPEGEALPPSKAAPNSTADAAVSEASRQRWLAEDAKRVQPKR